MSAIFRRIGQPEPAPPWGFFTAVNTTFAAFVAIALLGTTVAFVLFPDLTFVFLVGWALGAALTIAYVNFSRRNQQAALNLEPRSSRLFLVLLFGFGVAMAIDAAGLFASGLFLPTPELAYLLPARDNLIGWVVAGAFILFLQPMAEQLVFSGVFYPAAQQALGGWGGYIVSVMVFGLFHYLVYGFPPVNGLWPSLIVPLLSGFIIIGARASSGSTRAAIAAQMGFGLFALVKLLVLPL